MEEDGSWRAAGAADVGREIACDAAVDDVDAERRVESSDERRDCVPPAALSLVVVGFADKGRPS